MKRVQGGMPPAGEYEGCPLILKPTGGGRVEHRGPLSRVPTNDDNAMILLIDNKGGHSERSEESMRDPSPFLGRTQG